MESDSDCGEFIRLGGMKKQACVIGAGLFLLINLWTWLGDGGLRRFYPIVYGFDGKRRG